MLPMRTVVWMVGFVFMVLSPVVAAGDVLVFCLDTSGSMQKQGRFDAAKSVLTRHIRDARPGDVVYLIAFDSNDYPLGRIEVGEDGNPEAKEQLIATLQRLKARGRYTNLDQPLKAAKALLLEERAPGARKIVILSDGVSDPSPDHSKVDLTGIAQMIPQTLGWAVYIVGLPDDIAGLFQTPSPETGLVLASEEPHIKGIALARFSRAKLEEAVAVAKTDTLPSVGPPLPALAPPVGPETTPAPLPVEDSPPSPCCVPPSPRPAWPLLGGLLSALLLAGLGVVPLVRRRPERTPRAVFVLEVQEETGEAKRVPLVLREGEKKTLGPRGDIPLVGHPELPAVVGALHWSKGRLWLTPQDTMTVNGRSVTSRTPVGPGDQLKVRDSVRIMIDEGEETT